MLQFKMTTIQEDYSLARRAAIQYDSERCSEGIPLYLSRLNLHRFRDEGISAQELQRLVKTETESARIISNALEQLLKDTSEGLLN